MSALCFEKQNPQMAMTDIFLKRKSLLGGLLQKVLLKTNEWDSRNM